MNHRRPYDIRISGEPIQQVASVEPLSPRYIRERTGDFSDSRLAGKLGSIASGHLLLVPSNISRMTANPSTTEDISLLEAPELRHTRHESRLAVAFGQLSLVNTQRETAAELVAVKYTSPALAAREFAGATTIRSRLGEGATFAPVGFVKRDSGRNNIGYLTRYRHEATTLDAVFWNEEATSDQRLHGVHRAGEWLASLHNHDIAHGDAEPKNIAHDSADNPIYVDLETAHDLRDTIMPTRHQLADISDFLRFQETKLSEQELDGFVGAYLDTYERHDISREDIAEHQKPLAPVQHYSAE